MAAIDFDFELRMGVDLPNGRGLDFDVLFSRDAYGCHVIGAFEVLGVDEHSPERALSRRELVKLAGLAEVERLDDIGTKHFHARHP